MWKNYTLFLKKKAEIYISLLGLYLEFRIF